MKSEKPFFVGYLPCPKELLPFLWVATISFVLGSVVLAFAIGFDQDDPGPGALRGDYGRQTVQGVIELTPTPVLHVTQGTDHIPVGHTLMISGQGKNGAAPRAVPLNGQLAEASGALLERGDLKMLQLRGGRNGLKQVDGIAEPVSAPEALGRWKLAGEICDGKCLSGIMRPGEGLSHKACANLCIAGGIPPVFVSSQPIEGERYLMVAGVNAETSLAEELFKWVGVYIELEGDITRHGDLLILRIDPQTVEVAS